MCLLAVALEGTLVENRCHVREGMETLQQKVTCNSYVHLVRRHEQQSTLTGTHEGTERLAALQQKPLIHKDATM